MPNTSPNGNTGMTGVEANSLVLSMAVERQDVGVEMLTCCNLAGIYRTQDDMQQAAQYLEQAMNALSSVADPSIRAPAGVPRPKLIERRGLAPRYATRKLVWLHVELSLYYEQHGDIDDARAALLTAQEALSDGDDVQASGIILDMLDEMDDPNDDWDEMDGMDEPD